MDPKLKKIVLTVVCAICIAYTTGTGFLSLTDLVRLINVSVQMDTTDPAFLGLK